MCCACLFLQVIVFQFLVFCVVKTVYCCTSLASALIYLASLDKIWHIADSLAEIALVQFLVKNGFIEFLDVSHGKFLGQEFQGNGGVAYLVLKPVDGLLHHLHVVEVKHRQTVYIYPLAVEFFQQVLVVMRFVQQCIVGYADNATTGISVNVTKCFQLFQEQILYSRPFSQYSVCSLVQSLVFLNKTAHGSKFAIEWFYGTVLEQDLQVALFKTEDNAIHSYVVFWFVCVVLICHLMYMVYYNLAQRYK